MQNHENHKFTQLWKEKGYYILLSLCILAVGVSGYFFITGAMDEQEAVQESLSVPVTIEEPREAPAKEPEQPKKTTTKPASAETELVEAPAPELPLTVMPVSGTVSRDYAMDHLTYHATTQDWRVHTGVDLSAQLGDTVKAAKAGTVTAVYDDEYYGTTVVIQHEGGFTTHYCSLAAETQVVSGDIVTAGQPLGTVGGTALLEAAEEPHLHFEVYHNGEPTDPAGFLY